MARLIISVMIIFCSLALQVEAHGLSLSEGKTLLYDRIDNIMVKIELTPNDLQFNQENEMEISIIDVSEAGIFNNDIQLKINNLDVKDKTQNIFAGEYQKGIFKQPISFQAGGTHELELYLPDVDKVFNFKFELKDNRSFAYTTALITIVFFSIFTCLTRFTIKYRRNQ